MRNSEGDCDYVPDTPLLAQHQNVIVLTYYRRPNPSVLFLRRCLLFTTVILLLSAAIYFLFPSDPSLKLARIRLNHIRVNSFPKLTLDVSFSLTVKVRNRDFFSLDYSSLNVAVGYRGRVLALVRSRGGKVRARTTSYISATLDLDGLEVIHDVLYLIEDLARGIIPFDTETMIEGEVGLLFFKIPIKGRVACEVYVSTTNKKIVHQDCYPEVRNTFLNNLEICLYYRSEWATNAFIVLCNCMVG
uniref:Late embryogenesis abundant protein LEA-2 subgroup domain-containing protein n=1 Tax=Rhizophora mucronata TaxID=61149 RepID=A0A2P2IT81_RHIMU